MMKQNIALIFYFQIFMSSSILVSMDLQLQEQQTEAQCINKMFAGHQSLIAGRGDCFRAAACQYAILSASKTSKYLPFLGEQLKSVESNAIAIDSCQSSDFALAVQESPASVVSVVSVMMSPEYQNTKVTVRQFDAVQDKKYSKKKKKMNCGLQSLLSQPQGNQVADDVFMNTSIKLAQHEKEIDALNFLSAGLQGGDRDFIAFHNDLKYVSSLIERIRSASSQPSILESLSLLKKDIADYVARGGLITSDLKDAIHTEKKFAVKALLSLRTKNEVMYAILKEVHLSMMSIADLLKTKKCIQSPKALK